MNPIFTLFPVLLFALCPFQTLAQQLPKSQSEGLDLIIKTCSHTPYNDLCKTILQSVPKSNGADLYGLARIALEIASENASDAYENISKIQNNSTDHFIEQCLTDCLESYQDAIDQIEDSITAMDFKAYNDVQTWVTVAMTDADTCEHGFKEKPGHQSPITQINTVFNQLCSISLAIATLLTGESHTS